MNTSTQIIEIKTDGKGCSYCDIPITKEQWINLLRDKSVTTAERMRVLLSVYFMPEHKASCLQCAEKYGTHFNLYNSGNSAFGKAVIKKVGTFTIMENGKQRFWYAAMGKG